MIDILHELPVDEIAEIEELGRRCHKLDVVGPSYATVELEVKDLKNDKVVSKYADLSRSWTRNFYNVLAGNTLGCANKVLGTTFGAGQFCPKQTNGNALNGTDPLCLGGNAYGSNLGPNAWTGVVANTSKGIVIGTDATAESIDDYRMNALIAEGTGTGQMNYAAMSAPTVTWESSPKKFKCVGVRAITNNSSGSIDVKETGIYSYIWVQYSEGENGFGCIVRDKLASTVACAAASLVTVTYTLYSPAYPA
jgi:hypothetical protein